MKEMVIVNFYKKYEANWDELQMMALDTIAKMEETLEDVEIGELSVYQQYEDYRTACMQGLKTFILQVLNDWENMNILVLNGEFYKKDNDSIIRIHKSCFKNSESSYVLAYWIDINHDEKTPDLKFVGGRPFELTKEEMVDFMDLAKCGQQEIENILNDFDEILSWSCVNLNKDTALGSIQKDSMGNYAFHKNLLLI